MFLNFKRAIVSSNFKLLFIVHQVRWFTMAGSVSNWRGVPITEIYGSQSPWGSPEFPLISPSYNHVVLFHIPSNGTLDGDRPPKPQVGQDKWDHNYVRMPCSNHSLYPVQGSNGETHLKKRWEIIQRSLWKPIRNSEELAEVILSYNTKFKNTWKFHTLHKLFNEYLEEDETQYFFDVTLPEIAKLALQLPKLVQSAIPLLKQDKNMSISLSQQQIASLLANAFFCTFPRRNSMKKASEYATYPHINFNALYNASGSDSVLEKLKCLCHYFRRVCTKVPVGALTFRRVVAKSLAPSAWSDSSRQLGSLPVHIDSHTNIEDAHGLIQVDFANKYLGGGVLGNGCVQEEIRFVICPELMISMLFTEELRSNEALMMIGSERYSSYSGYGNTFQWTGDYCDVTPFDSSTRRRCAVLAIDAMPYSSVVQEYDRDMITREMNKALIGASVYADTQSDSLQYPGLATGNWGCGAFGGSPQLKCMIQMMAYAQARRPMAYYTFGDVELRDQIINMYNLLARYNVTVGQLYKYILQFSQTDVRRLQLHAFIQQALKNEYSRKCSNKPDATDLDKSNVRREESEDNINKILQNESPDMFSQDELTMSTEETNDVSKTNRTVECKDEVRTGTTMTSSENHTSRLFHEMSKLDECGGRLNLTERDTFALGDNVLNSRKNDAPVNYEENQVVDAKRRLSNKITDYFSKKSI